MNDENFTTIRVLKEDRDKLRAKYPGVNISDSLHKLLNDNHILTAKQINELVDLKIEEKLAEIQY